MQIIEIHIITKKNHENLRNPCNNNENHENPINTCENNKIMKIIEIHARIMKLTKKKQRNLNENYKHHKN